ncbi:PAP2 family protein [Herminiimonas aquatilis]|uniref:PAP2 family protein n=1 Tax=Herminiimonas aquatilis TaxID=345342 RepID=A0ABW2J8D6_9BURK
MILKKNYQSFYIFNVIGLTITGLLFVWLSNNGTIDFWITKHFYDDELHIFSFQNSKFLESIGHKFLKDLTACILIVGILLSIASYVIAALRPLRRPLIGFCVMAIASALFISYLKSISIHSCPWDLQMYGGQAKWFPLFSGFLTANSQGHCWPGGHASGGFALIAGYFSFREYRPHLASAFLFSGFLFGSLMSFVQIVRGAHFLSHNLWTLWFIWTICLVIDGIFRLICLLQKNSPSLNERLHKFSS